MSRLIFAGLMAAAAIPAAAQVVPPMARAPMGQRVITRTEIPGMMAEMFARIDSNRDGFITKAEIDAAHQGRRGQWGKGGNRDAADAMHRDPAAAFDRIDANRDGTVSRDEFTRAHAMHAERQGNRQGGRRGMAGMGAGLGGEMFERADTNRDGRVTLAEAQVAATAHFDMADANRDSRVTAEERQAAHQRMKQLHAGH